MRTTAEIMSEIILFMPIASFSIRQLENKIEQLHGATLYAICSDDVDGRSWLEYLQDTIIDMIRFKKENENA